MMWNNSKTVEIEYYFDLTAVEVTMILHRFMHKLENLYNKRLVNFVIEQGKEHYKHDEEKTFTVIVYVSERILTADNLASELKKLPQVQKRR